MQSTMPGSPKEKSEYFHESSKYFYEYRWVYDFKATRILTEDVLQAVPLTFQEFLQSLEESSDTFHEILHLNDNTDWPTGIRAFIRQSIRLKKLALSLKNRTDTGSLVRILNPTGKKLDSSPKLKLPKKWNPKKYFEVVHVGNFVGFHCNQANCDAVIDIGSGLGYLSRHIASEFNIPVVGLESDPSRVKTATNESLPVQPNVSSGTTSFVCMRITENISEEISPYIENYNSLCITALHACGDLTPWSLNHFIKTSSCKMIAVVPCCYHKMDVNTKNFPMSSYLTQELTNYEDASFLKNQWLWRLASQRAGNQFLNDICKETKHLFYRAVLEIICEKENLHLKRRKRSRQDSNYSTFHEYSKNSFGENGIFDVYKESSKLDETELNTIIELMQIQHDKLIKWSRIITGILALQGAMQEVAEDLILIDRLAYIEKLDVMKESGLIKVIPDEVTPRGMVLFGIKK